MYCNPYRWKIFTKNPPFCRDLPVWIRESSSTRKLVTLEGWVNLPVKSHWKMNISANFCRTVKSFGWLQNNFLRSSLNFPCLIAAEQYAYCCGGKINFWSHLGEERPGKPQIFHTNPSCSRIDSIKSAGNRSQKVTFITYPRHFLETIVYVEFTPVAGPIFETKNRAIFLERFFGRGITAREQLSRAKNSLDFK